MSCLTSPGGRVFLPNMKPGSWLRCPARCDVRCARFSGGRASGSCSRRANAAWTPSSTARASFPGMQPPARALHGRGGGGGRGLGLGFLFSLIRSCRVQLSSFARCCAICRGPGGCNPDDWVTRLIRAVLVRAQPLSLFLLPHFLAPAIRCVVIIVFLHAQLLRHAPVTQPAHTLNLAPVHCVRCIGPKCVCPRALTSLCVCVCVCVV